MLHWEWWFIYPDHWSCFFQPSHCQLNRYDWLTTRYFIFAACGVDVAPGRAGGGWGSTWWFTPGVKVGYNYNWTSWLAYLPSWSNWGFKLRISYSRLTNWSEPSSQMTSNDTEDRFDRSSKFSVHMDAFFFRPCFTIYTMIWTSGSRGVLRLSHPSLRFTHKTSCRWGWTGVHQVTQSVAGTRGFMLWTTCAMYIQTSTVNLSLSKHGLMTISGNTTPWFFIDSDLLHAEGFESEFGMDQQGSLLLQVPWRRNG